MSKYIESLEKLIEKQQLIIEKLEHNQKIVQTLNKIQEKNFQEYMEAHTGTILQNYLTNFNPEDKLYTEGVEKSLLDHAKFNFVLHLFKNFKDLPEFKLLIQIIEKEFPKEAKFINQTQLHNDFYTQ